MGLRVNHAAMKIIQTCLIPGFETRTQSLCLMSYHGL